MSPTRVCVIGWFGVATAKTYLEIDPDIDLTILEAENSLGGTWSKNRIYPTLLAQQTTGIYEYADMSLEEDPHEERRLKDEFIPSQKLHDYMEKYAIKYGVLDRIKFNIHVTKLECTATIPRRWTVWTQEAKEPQVYDKVIIATGLTSEPSLPKIEPGDFQPPIFHTKDIGMRDEWMCSADVSSVTIYGGGKSALDCVYLCAKAGKQVHWVSRPDNIGSGVAQLLPNRVMGKNSNDIVASRFGSKMHPSLESCDDGWYRFLHSGQSLGFRLHWEYWRFMSKVILGKAGYNKSTNMGLLKPEVMGHGPFWVNVAPSIVTHTEMLDWIHSGKNIKIYRDTIASLSGNNVHLDSGQSHSTDALVYATGYEIVSPIYSPELSATLGVPTRVEDYPKELEAKWEALEKRADSEVVRTFPRLRSPPPSHYRPPVTTPYRLYKSILPTQLAKDDDHSLVFVGAIGSLNTAIISEAIALWAVAWLTESLNLKNVSVEDMEWDVALHVAFSRRRYLHIGRKSPYALYEYLPMVDSLLGQVGVNPRRKAGKAADFFKPYKPKDYRGLVQEWIQQRQPSVDNQ